METKEMATFYIDNKHEYFFIKNGALYEVFKGSQTSKVRHRLHVPEEEDCERLTDFKIKQIEKKYLR